MEIQEELTKKYAYGEFTKNRDSSTADITFGKNQNTKRHQTKEQDDKDKEMTSLWLENNKITKCKDQKFGNGGHSFSVIPIWVAGS